MSKTIDADPLEPFAVAAARIVRQRTDDLVAESEGVLDTGDIERVHDMRVATRRLRAVLEIFAPCFPKAEHKAVLEEVKALADALGERRDPDVQLAALEAFAEAAPATARSGVELLATRVKARQEAANGTLAAALETAREQDLAGRLRALADQAVQ